jgi:hypothetical protein
MAPAAHLSRRTRAQPRELRASIRPTLLTRESRRLLGGCSFSASISPVEPSASRAPAALLHDHYTIGGRGAARGLPRSPKQERRGRGAAPQRRAVPVKRSPGHAAWRYRYSGPVNSRQLGVHGHSARRRSACRRRPLETVEKVVTGNAAARCPPATDVRYTSAN